MKQHQKRQEEYQIQVEVQLNFKIKEKSKLIENLKNQLHSDSIEKML
jgi:hypothetical protein